MQFGANYIYLIMIAAFSCAVIGIVVYNRMIFYREKRTTRRVQRLNAQLTLIMDANKTEVWTFSARKNRFKVISKQQLVETRYTPFEFSQFYDRDDFVKIQQAIGNIQRREALAENLTVRSAPASDGTTKTYEMTLSVLRRNKRDMPSEILGTQRDISEETRRAEENKNLMLRYHTVFNSSLVDMIYYDANGYLADLNDKACETFGVKDPQALIRRRIRMTDIPSYRDMDIDTLEHTVLSSITDITSTKAQDERVPEITRHGKMYYDAMVGPIRDQHNQLLGIITAGYDITEMVEADHKQKEQCRMIEQRNNALQRYIRDINYSLKISESRLVNYYPDCHELEILSDLTKAGKRIPQMEVVALMHNTERHRAKSLIRRMDRRRPGNISATLHTKLKDQQKREMYLNFDLMPITDATGRVTHYFGICRNDTEMAYTELRLKEESAKAQEEEQLKNSFLLNMSYELRGPLHAVIGFAELFKTEHNEEDEKVFANEIKNNTDVLLNLINDILFISRLDAHMIEYHYAVCDFAELFDGWCQQGWKDSSNLVTKIVNNAYSRLLVNIDKHNLGIAIEKLCRYVVMSASEGLMKTRYEYLHDELIIIVDNSGGGMDIEDANNAFDRFVNNSRQKRIGTGLDLPIVKELVEQMGGTIDVLSEPGKGCSFFIALPCQMIDYERKIAL